MIFQLYHFNLQSRPGLKKFFLRISNLQSSIRHIFTHIHTSSHSRKQSAFGGYNMSTGVKAHVAGSCGCKAGWFEVFPRLCKQGMCGSLAGWFQVAIQAVDWCSRASSIGLRCRFCEVHRRHLMHGGTQTIRFWGLHTSSHFTHLHTSYNSKYQI